MPRLNHDPVHHHVDIVPEFLVERGRVVEIVELTIHLDPLEALLAQLQEFLAIFALAVAHDGASR